MLVWNGAIGASPERRGRTQEEGRSRHVVGGYGVLDLLALVGSEDMRGGNLGKEVVGVVGRGETRRGGRTG